MVILFKKKDSTDSRLSLMRSILFVFLLHSDICKWISIKGCTDLLLEVKPHNDRIGPLVVVGLLNDSMLHANLNIPPTLRSQVCSLWLILGFIRRKLILSLICLFHPFVTPSGRLYGRSC